VAAVLVYWTGLHVCVCGCSTGDRLKREQSLDERLKNEFMLQQLVNLVSSLDLSDELARSVMSLSLALYCLKECTLPFISGYFGNENPDIGFRKSI